MPNSSHAVKSVFSWKSESECSKLKISNVIEQLKKKRSARSAARSAVVHHNKTMKARREKKMKDDDDDGHDNYI